MCLSKEEKQRYHKTINYTRLMRCDNRTLVLLKRSRDINLSVKSSLVTKIFRSVSRFRIIIDGLVESIELK